MKLIEWFQQNHSFCINKNFKEVVFISEDEDADIAAFMCALRKLEKLNMLSQETVNGNVIYTLERPMESVDQNISISAPVAKSIALIINKVVERENIKEDFCDFTNLREKDIKNLIHIIDSLMEK